MDELSINYLPGEFGLHVEKYNMYVSICIAIKTQEMGFLNAGSTNFVFQSIKFHFTNH